MGGSYFSDAGSYLVSIIFEIYVFAILIRFLLQWVRADFYNPISQMLVKITNPALLPLRKIIPGWGGIDVAAIVLAILLTMIEYALLLIMHGGVVGVVSLALLSLAMVLKLSIYIFIGCIFVLVIFSWVNPNPHNPIIPLIHQLCRPVLAPFQRIIPSLGGLDLSPIIAIITLNLCLRLPVAMLIDVARSIPF